MPALAQGEDGKRPEIATVVSGVISPRPESVRQRVDRERQMEQDNRRNGETPERKLKTGCWQPGVPECLTQRVQHRQESQGWNDVKTIDPSKLGIL